MKTRDSWFVVLVTLLLAGGTLALRAQAPDTAPPNAAALPNTAALRAQLEERYNVVPLQNGIALTPLKAAGAVRLIEIKDGVISLNGDVVSARDLRQRLGGDADLLLRVTYLDAEALKALAGRVAAVEEEREDALDRARQRARTDSRDRAAEDIERRRSKTRRGDTVRFGSSVTIGADEYIDGNLVVIGGSADVQGEVTDNVTVIGGALTLGPQAVVGDNVVVVGGTLKRAPGARVDGKVDEVGIGGMGPMGRDRPQIRPWSPTFTRVGSLVGTLVRVGLLALVMLLVTALGSRYVESIASRTSADAVRSGLTGLLTQVLWFPLLALTCLVLVISIIGIPLLLLVPFAIVLALVLALVGFTGVAHQAGRVIAARFHLERASVYSQVMLGLAAIVACSVLAKLVGLLGGVAGFASGALTVVGYLIEYVAWTVGIGAVVLTWLSTRRGRSMPGPAQAVAAPVSEEGLR